jgi:hypothetical protein
MTIQIPKFVRAAHLRAAHHLRSLRPLVIATTLVAASAHVATAAPMTLAYSFDTSGSPFGKFDTNLGTLLGIDISLSSVLSAINPFVNQVPNSDTCTAVFSGASMTVSAAGTPTLLTLSGGGTTTSQCGQFEFGVSAPQVATALDASLFATFSSAGPSPMALLVATAPGTATFTHGTDTKAGDPFWYPHLTAGLVTYTYCPVGQDCTDPPPTPPSVPEPATVMTLAMGFAGILAGRRYRR